MNDPIPPTAGKTGIPREVRTRLLEAVCDLSKYDHIAAGWLRYKTFPVDPPWVPDPDAIKAMTVATPCPSDLVDVEAVGVGNAYAAARLTRLHDAGWELTRTEAPR